MGFFLRIICFNKLVYCVVYVSPITLSTQRILSKIWIQFNNLINLGFMRMTLVQIQERRVCIFPVNLVRDWKRLIPNPPHSDFYGDPKTNRGKSIFHKPSNVPFTTNLLNGLNHSDHNKQHYHSLPSLSCIALLWSIEICVHIPIKEDEPPPSYLSQLSNKSQWECDWSQRERDSHWNHNQS